MQLYRYKMRNKIFVLSVLVVSNLSCVAQSVERPYKNSVATNPFWNNWYVQFGLDMSLQNPYGKDFGAVFPYGKTFGINVAVGKWFTPEFGFRFRINWENWLFKNNHLSWVAPFGRNGENYSGGGYGEFVGEMHFNLHNLFGGYNEKRIWHLSVYPRAGLVSNFAIGSCSPLIGLGSQNTWKINSRMKVFLDMAYQMTTSEFVDCVTNTGMGSGSNGFFNIDIGLLIELGKNSFQRIR